MEEFTIQIEKEEIPEEYAIEQNTKKTLLRHWQLKAIEAFEACKNGKIIYSVATGAGKTKLGIELIKKIWETHPEYYVLIVVPKNVILETGWFKELYTNGINLKDIGVYYGSIKEYSKVTITNMQNLHKIATEQFQILILDEVHHSAARKYYPYLTLPN